MVLSEVIGKIDRTDKNKDDSCIWDLCEFQRELNICQESVMQNEHEARLMGYWVAKTYDSDSHVGLRAYFFDDKFAAISFQSGRRSDEVFEWASQEIALEVRNYILSLSMGDEVKVKVANMEKDIGDGLAVHFASELLVNTVLYEDKLVSVVAGKRDYLSKEITIRHDGEEKVVKTADILVPWNIVN